MAGGTSIFDMIKRHKKNENLRKKKYFKNKNSYTLKLDSVNLDYKTASKEQLAEIRKRVLEERKAEQQKSIRILILSVLIVVILIPIFLYFVNWLMSIWS